MLNYFNQLIIFLLMSVSLLSCNSSDSGSKTVDNNIVPSSFSYERDFFDLEKNTQLNITQPNVSGTNLVFTVSPELPTGLYLNRTEGYLAGIPRVVTGEQEYVVTASNSKGSVSTKIKIRIRDKILPSISYAQNRYSFMIGTSLGVINPIIQGGTSFVRFEVSPALPAGVNFNTNTGQITGSSATVIANSFHSVSAYTIDNLFVSTSISFEFTDLPPQNLSYNPPLVIVQKGTTIIPNIPSSSGGPIVSYEISPALPIGMNFDTSSGLISGTPANIQSLTSYIITGKNSGGTTNTTFSLQVNDLPPQNLSYGTTTFIMKRTLPFNLVVPVYSGGTALSFSISEPLPAGLVFNTTNGSIMGTPTVVMSQKSFTITAVNSGGTTTAVLNITVEDIPPQNLSYPVVSEILTKNTTNVNWSPTIGGGAVSLYTSSPALPAGLTLNPTTGVISGTPTQIITVPVSYTIRASNLKNEYSEYSFYIGIKDEAPKNLNYALSEIVLTKGVAMSPLSPSTTAGTATNYFAAPLLPTGISVDPLTGIISGTSTIVAERTRYTVTAQNSSGSTVKDVYITVNDAAPANISYGATNFTWDRGAEISELTPTNSGGDIVIYSIAPALPSGVFIDPNTGKISGSPLEFHAEKDYVISGTNTGGTTTTTIKITINDYAPIDLAYSTTNEITLRLGVPIHESGYVPSYQGGTVINFNLASGYSLPAGLSLNSTTGAITGTPTSFNSIAQVVRVVATNTGGSTTTDLSIRILDRAPVLDLAIVEYRFVKGTTIQQIKPTITGGIPTSFSLSDSMGTLNPTLPVGLSFNATAGAITGTPTVEFEESIFGITGANDGGDSTVYFKIKVVEVIPSNINYGINNNLEVPKDLHNYETNQPSPYTPINILPTKSGGPVVSWTITPALPTGLLFNTLTGAITGVPREGTDAIDYTITATNTGGTATATLRLKIKDVAPINLRYEFNEYIKDATDYLFISAPENDGGDPTVYSITPALPQGLFFDTTDGSILKIGNLAPTNLITYTVRAANSEGFTTTTIKIRINPALPGTISYYQAPGGMENAVYFTLGNTNSVSYIPENDGGLITGCSGSNPYVLSNVVYLTEGPNFATDNDDLIETSTTLPAGITFNTTTGVIGGKVSVDTGRYLYKVKIVGCNAAGLSDEAAVFIVLNRRPVASIVNDDVETTIGVETTLDASPSTDPDFNPLIIIDPNPSENWIGKDVNGYSWTLKSAPVGIDVATFPILNSDSAVMTFTPTKIGNYVFEVVAKDDLSNSLPKEVAVFVKDIPPSNISYGGGDFGFESFIFNQGMSRTITPVNDGGEIVSYSIKDKLTGNTNPLDSGVNLNTTTGVISGNPAGNGTDKVYVITGCNTGGCSEVDVRIWFNKAPVASINSVSKTSNSTVSFNGSGSVDADRSIANTAPWNGLNTSLTYSWKVVNKPAGSSVSNTSFSNSTAMSPTINLDFYGSYTFSLIVSDGRINSTQVNKTITYGKVASGFVYTPGSSYGNNNFVFTRDNETVNLTPVLTGESDPIDSYSITPSLPAGLSFNTSSGVISGKATESRVTTNYTITASNNGGDVSITLKLWINEPPIADAGSDTENALVGSQVTLNGNLTNDPDSSEVNKNPFNGMSPYIEWELVGIPPTSARISSSITNRNTKSARITPDVEGVYVLKITQFDGLVNNKNNAITKITTQNNQVEDRIVADAGPDIISSNLGINVSLDALNSYPNSTANATFDWEIVSKPSESVVDLTSSSGLNSSFVPDVEGSYIIKLTVSSGLNIEKDFVVVNVGTVSTAPSTISSNTTWTKEMSPIFLNGQMTVSNNSILTIEEGVSIIGAANNSGMIRISSGKLVVNGTANIPVFFNRVNVQKPTSAGNISLDLNYLEMISGGLCLIEACNQQVIIKNSIFKDLVGTSKIESTNSNNSIENNIFINSHGFEISTIGIYSFTVKNNFFYKMKGIDGTPLTSAFAFKVKSGSNSNINITENWFVNDDNRKVINSESINGVILEKNYWQNNNPIYNNTVIKNMLSGSQIENILFEPFFTKPSNDTVSGKKYLP